MNTEEFARAIGVSRSTVSRVLNNSPRVSEETRAKVLRAIKELDFQPNSSARNLVLRKADSIGLIIVYPRKYQKMSANLFYDPYFQGSLAGVTETAYARRYGVSLYLVEDDPREMIHPLKRRQVAGAVVLISRHDPELCDLVLSMIKRGDRVPLVFLDPPIEIASQVTSVSGPNYQGAKAAVSYLLGMGHRRVACINGSLNNRCAIDRFRGYTDALKEAGVEFDQSLVACGDFLEEGGKRALFEIFSRGGRPSAIFAANDRMAIGAMRALKVMDVRVPDQVSLVGFDGIEVSAYVAPPLTTVRYPFEEFGRIAAERLFDKLEGREVTAPSRPEYEAELIVRQSSTNPWTG